MLDWGLHSGHAGCHPLLRMWQTCVTLNTILTSCLSLALLLHYCGDAITPSHVVLPVWKAATTGVRVHLVAATRAPSSFRHAAAAVALEAAGLAAAGVSARLQGRSSSAASPRRRSRGGAHSTPNPIPNPGPNPSPKPEPKPNPSPSPGPNPHPPPRCVVSVPSASAQDWHSDGVDEGIYNVFVPLVPLTARNGPTELRPGSQ